MKVSVHFQGYPSTFRGEFAPESDGLPLGVVTSGVIGAGVTQVAHRPSRSVVLAPSATAIVRRPQMEAHIRVTCATVTWRRSVPDDLIERGGREADGDVEFGAHLGRVDAGGQEHQADLHVRRFGEPALLAAHRER